MHSDVLLKIKGSSYLNGSGLRGQSAEGQTKEESREKALAASGCEACRLAGSKER